MMNESQISLSKADKRSVMEPSKLGTKRRQMMTAALDPHIKALLLLQLMHVAPSS